LPECIVWVQNNDFCETYGLAGKSSVSCVSFVTLKFMQMNCLEKLLVVDSYIW